jgi:excisionase family DNA binding protein
METLSFENLPQAVANLKESVSEIKQLLIEKINEQPEADQLLIIQQAAELLNISVSTIYGLVNKETIPVMKKGKRLYFSKQELIAWVKAGRKKTVSEIEAEAHQYLKKKGANNG